MHHGLWSGPDDTSSYAEATDRYTDYMIDKLDAGPGQKILDVGCGAGRPALRLAATGASVLGISVSDADVRLATERAQSEGLADQVRFEKADVLRLPYADASFDRVIALESIPHIADRAAAMADIARVLRPGGRPVVRSICPTARRIGHGEFDS